MTPSKNPDELIHNLGGCGRFQVRMAVIVHMMKTLVSFSMVGMIYIMATPNWQCADDSELYNQTFPWKANQTTFGAAKNQSVDKTCHVKNGTKCTKFTFDDNMRTAAAEFSLVCDNEWIPAMIVSIQTGGLLLGHLISGQTADAFGRKTPILIALCFLITFNVVSYFATSWIMFAITRVFIGIGCAFFLTVQYPLLSEFALGRWRSWMVGFPSWPIQGCLLALVLWLVRDWKTFCLIVALLGVPFIGAWWLLPESFRWYLAHERVEDATKVIESVARVNKREVPDISGLVDFGHGPEMQDRKYTVIDLFRSRFLVKLTLVSTINWFGMGFISYGVGFGIASLSGNIFLNIFLISLLAIPSQWIAVGVQNRYGRRKTAVACFAVTFVSALAVGIVQYIDTDRRDLLTNVFAMVANAGIGTVWSPVQTMTIELYPTVVRNIGFGFLSTIGRLAAVIGPQFVYLSKYVSGLLYFVSAVLAALCIVGLMGLPETKDANLQDRIRPRDAAQ